MEFLNDLLKPLQDFIVDNAQAMTVVLIVVSLFLIILFIVAFSQVGKIKSLKSRLAQASQNEQTVATVQKQLEDLNLELNSLKDTNSTLTQQLDGLKQHSDALLELNQSLNIEIANTKTENEKLLLQQSVRPVPKKSTKKAAESDTTVVLEEDDETIEVKEENAAKNEGFILKYDRLKGDWSIKKKGATRATRRADTKEEAVKIAKELSRKYNVSLSIHKKDGKFQKQ